MTDPRGAHSACLGLGSNQDPDRFLPRALALLRRSVAVEAVSAAWESPAVGATGADFVNAALLVRAALSRDALTGVLKRVETRLGRTRDADPSGPVVVAIDIDLLTYDDDVLEPGLWSLAHRGVPVSELLPDLTCPTTGESLARAARRLARSTPIRPRAGIFPTSSSFRSARPAPRRASR